MVDASMVERIWWGGGAPERAARLALLPLETLYAGIVAARGALYDAGLLAAHDPVLPAVSVGNLTVGGTGKTPVSAWIAAALRARGGRPAVVMRGVGGDEPLVHSTLNPDVPVVVSPDRLAGVARARALGADVAVLDDAFQHRRARRVADMVLVSADRWSARRRLLPAGPWREPLGALRRAGLLVVTRKAAASIDVAAVLEEARRVAPTVPTAVIHLAPGALQRVGSDAMLDLAELEGASVLAVSAIGDPQAFHRQLAAAGAAVTPAAFPDHHAFTPEHAADLARRGEGMRFVVCTLKDAVKLAPSWPRAAPSLWYVSQRVVVERGRDEIDRLLDALLAASIHHSSMAGTARSH